MDEHIRRKWEALNRFTQKLLSGPCGAQVAKIVLFGSVSKEESRPESDIDAAYNAAELCVKGLLLLRLDDIPGSHGGLVGKFGELYVQTGELPRELGRRLNKGLDARAAARYDYAAQITEEMARDVLQLARELIGHLRQMAGEDAL